MKQYYYANGDQQLGPFTLQELQSKNLSKDTYVWYEGLSDWTRAGDLPELNSLFEAAATATPPPGNTGTAKPGGFGQPVGGYNQPTQGGYNQPYNPPSGNKPKTWLVEAILVTVLCCLPGGIVAIVYASQVDTKWAQGDTLGAQKSSDNAKLWTMISLGVSLVFIVLYVIIVAMSVASGGF